MPKNSTTEILLPSDTASNSRLNSLRAAVLGANDGIVSTASVVMGVAGATSDRHAIIIAGLAALVAGALSMAVGEYVSVSSQADAEKAYIAEEKEDLRDRASEELEELTREYQKLGVSRDTSEKVARELTKHDALKAHLRIHFNLDPSDINSPWQAGLASLIAFTAGGLVPMLAIVLTPNAWHIGATVTAVVLALILTGFLSALATRSNRLQGMARVLVGGILAMTITYFVGKLFGVVAG